MDLRTLALCAIALVAASCTPLSQAQAPSTSLCTAPGYHSFDFWLGNWDVYDVNGNVFSARVRVTSILNGCGVREEYSGVDGSRGESLSTFDPIHNVWHQFWVSSTGEIVDIRGGMNHGAMILTGPETGDRASLVRGIWKTEGAGVRETGLRSKDNGHTWSPWFDLHFQTAHR